MGGRVERFAVFSQEDGPMRDARPCCPPLPRRGALGTSSAWIARARPEDAELLRGRPSAATETAPASHPLLIRTLIRSQPNLADTLHDV